MSNYVWRNNMACVSTWVIMSSPKFMHQFEAPFEKSALITMGQLAYWPRLPMSPEMMKGLAWGTAQRFADRIAKTYTNQKQDPRITSDEIINELAKVLVNKNATLVDLAEATDNVFFFPDEK